VRWMSAACAGSSSRSSYGGTTAVGTPGSVRLAGPFEASGHHRIEIRLVHAMHAGCLQVRPDIL
jgi:hypothetical protein